MNNKERARKRRHNTQKARKKYFNHLTHTNKFHDCKICSCVMCGNPRKYNGNSKQSQTVQELRSNIDDKY